MYGLIGRMIARPGQRETLIGLMLEGTVDMPGCLIYVVARDAQDDDAVWITEVWDSQESHRASLAIPHVQAVIQRARPVIASFAEHHEIEPVGGVGITQRRDA